MKRYLVLSVVVAAFLLDGCFSVSVGTKKAGVPSRNPDYTSWQTLLIYGLVPISTHHKIQDICKDGVEAVKTYHSFLNGFVAFLTAEIYTPVTLQVWCKGGKTVKLEMSPDTPSRLKANLSPKEYKMFMKDVAQVVVDKRVAKK